MSDRRPLVVGTRGSALALAQTTIVCDALRARHPGLEVRVERITTTGDARTDVPLSQLGRGMFVTEIEAALREGRVDFAVHSAKDLPSTTAPDLVLAAFLPRADARDVLVSRSGTLATLPAGARVGTSSPRRACLVRAARPDLDTVDVRGNVDTRLRKLAAGEYDAIVLAAAGLVRLGRIGEATETFETEAMIPCVAQGALAVEARADDMTTIRLLAALDDAVTRWAVVAERAFLAELGAGCRAAVGAHARIAGVELQLDAMIGAPDGRLLRASRSGPVAEGAEIGASLARDLLLAGGAAFLAAGSTALRGKRVAVTRAEEQADALSALLAARGATAVACPTIGIQPLEDTAALDRELRRLSGVDWMVFTSMNAVTAMAQRIEAVRVQLPRAIRYAAVGPSTGALVSQHFGRVDFVPTRATARHLARELPLRNGDVVVFPRANLASDTLASVLRERGAVVRDIAVYLTVPGAGASRLAELVRNRSVDAVIFTSPSSLAFATEIGAAMRALGDDAPWVVTIGPSTTRAALEAGIRAHESPAAAVGAIVETLERLLVPVAATIDA